MPAALTGGGAVDLLGMTASDASRLGCASGGVSSPRRRRLCSRPPTEYFAATSRNATEAEARPGDIVRGKAPLTPSLCCRFGLLDGDTELRCAGFLATGGACFALAVCWDELDAADAGRGGSGAGAGDGTSLCPGFFRVWEEVMTGIVGLVGGSVVADTPDDLIGAAPVCRLGGGGGGACSCRDGPRMASSAVAPRPPFAGRAEGSGGGGSFLGV